MLTGNDVEWNKLQLGQNNKKEITLNGKNTDSDKRQKSKNVELIYLNVKVKNADGKKMLMYKALKSKKLQQKICRKVKNVERKKC